MSFELVNREGIYVTRITITFMFCNCLLCYCKTKACFQLFQIAILSSTSYHNQQSGKIQILNLEWLRSLTCDHKPSNTQEFTHRTTLHVCPGFPPVSHNIHVAERDNKHSYTHKTKNVFAGKKNISTLMVFRNQRRIKMYFQTSIIFLQIKNILSNANTS